MAHSAGFEPATARFVAEYSIQLSYECVKGAYGNDLGVGRQVIPGAGGRSGSLAILLVF